MNKNKFLESYGEAAAWRAERVAVCLAWPLVWVLFAWPWLSGAFTIPWDGKAHFAPQVQFMAVSFASGDWPWWAPNVFAGHPQIADPQSMLFSPPFVALALISAQPGPWEIDLVVLLVLLASGFGMLWLADDLGWHPAGGLIAAIAFALGAAMAWRLQHFGQLMSLAYLPFVMVFLRRAIVTGGLASGALAGLFAAFMALGRDQVALLAIYLLAGYALTLLAAGPDRWLRARRAALPLASGAVLAALIVAIPILLTAALASQSNRPSIGYLDAAAGSLHPALLLTGVAPNLFGAAGEMREYWGPPSFHWQGTGLYLAQNMGVVYIGALGLLLLVIGVVRGILWAPQIRYFTIAWLVILIYALGWYTPAFQAMHTVLPGVSLYRRPADAVFLLGGIGALLAGYVVHCLISDSLAARAFGSRSMILAAACIVGVIVAAAIAAVLMGRIEAAAWPLAHALFWFALAGGAFALVLWLMPIRPVVATLILAATLAGDVVLNNGPNGASALPRSDLDMLEPDARNPVIAALKRLLAREPSNTRRDRVELVGLGYHWPNTPLTHGVQSTLGANPVRLDHYVRATGAGDTAAEGGQRAFTPLFPSYRSRLADLLGLRFIVTGAPIETIDRSLRPGQLPEIARIGTARVYENRGALPRVLFATRAMQGNFAELVVTGRWPVGDPATSVVLEVVPAFDLQRRPGKIAIAAYRNTEVVVDVDSPDGGWIVLGDVWHPWWMGEIDGKPAPVLKANVIFRAIEVPAGRHRVRFVFRPLAGLWAWLAETTATRQAGSNRGGDRP